MAIVSCPECSKKLKVADTSVGKKVKCSCGNVFVAKESNGAPAKPAASAATPEKVMVACTECGAKLKVATTSLGKKMKCPKCAGVFVASIEEEEPPPPPKKAAKRAPEPEEEEDEEAPAPKKKGKPVNEDDMDDFFSFAEKDAAGHAEDEEEVKPKGKAKKAEPEEDEEEVPDWRKGKSDDLDESIEEDDAPRPKAKAGKKGPPPRPTGDDDKPAEKPKYASRTFLNLFVLFLLIVFIAGFAVVFLGVVDLGLPKAKIVPRKTNQAKKMEDAEKNNKEAIAKLEGTWIVESAESRGQPEPARKGQKVVFAEGKFTGLDVTAAPFSVDASYDPMQLDLVLPEKASVAGIYKIDGDRLEMCLKQSKKNNTEPIEHPKAFDSKSGLLLVLKRGKAEDKGPTVDNKAEAAKLNGAWIVVSAAMPGPALDALNGRRFVFADGIITTPDPLTAPFTVDAGKNPKWIELPTTAKVNVPGIYELDGDNLKWCTALPKAVFVNGKQTLQAGDRPTAFDAKQGVMIVLQREKKKVDDKDKGKDKNVAAKLDGSWVIESALAGGKPDEKTVGETLTFADGKVTGMGPDTVPYKTNFSKDPHWIDVTIPIKDKTANMAGIFKFDGDKLILCVSGPNGPRPASFDAKDAFVATLHRAGKGKGKDKDDGKYSRIQSANNLKQIGLAFHNYHDANRGLPPAASSGANDPTGKPLLSWRVAILPYLDEIDLYKQFDLNKPWDDPHNMKLIAKMPKVYMVPGVDAKPDMTHYRTLVGPGTPLDPQKDKTGKLVAKYTLANVPDGLSNVIMVVEATEPTIWTKPDDLPYDPKGPLPKFGVSPTGFNVLLADGSVRFVSPKVPEAVLRPWLTCYNGMPRQPLEGKAVGKEENLGKPKGKTKDEEKSKLKGPGPVDPVNIEIARAQMQALTNACNAYALRHEDKFPAALADLLKKDTQGNGPFLENEEALFDPWKQRFQYDPQGPKNDGFRPDIWTVAPDKQIIGNWQKNKTKVKDTEKKEPKLKDPDDSVDPAKTAAARAQIQVLTLAVQAYAVKNDGKFPMSLNALLEKDDKCNGPYLEKRGALMDPWMGFYRYNPDGTFNDGKLPDIWTESPSTERIGNWQKASAEKGKGKEK